MKCLKNKLLCTGLVITTLAFGIMFTSIRTNAIGAESFEAYESSDTIYDDIQSLEELVSVR